MCRAETRLYVVHEERSEASGMGALAPDVRACTVRELDSVLRGT
jgi:hypothetical protein